jgi:hypothetical protein
VFTGGKHCRRIAEKIKPSRVRMQITRRRKWPDHDAGDDKSKNKKKHRARATVMLLHSSPRDRSEIKKKKKNVTKLLLHRTRIAAAVIGPGRIVMTV